MKSKDNNSDGKSVLFSRMSLEGHRITAVWQAQSTLPLAVIS